MHIWSLTRISNYIVQYGVSTVIVYKAGTVTVDFHAAAAQIFHCAVNYTVVLRIIVHGNSVGSEVTHRAVNNCTIRCAAHENSGIRVFRISHNDRFQFILADKLVFTLAIYIGELQIAEFDILNLICPVLILAITLQANEFVGFRCYSVLKVACILWPPIDFTGSRIYAPFTRFIKELGCIHQIITAKNTIVFLETIRPFNQNGRHI